MCRNLRLKIKVYAVEAISNNFSNEAREKIKKSANLRTSPKRKRKKLLTMASSVEGLIFENDSRDTLYRNDRKEEGIDGIVNNCRKSLLEKAESI